ncbi:hypothetical protein SVIOM74S_02608 [Streptomyces violarus]
MHEHRTTAVAVTGPRGSRQHVYRLRDRTEPLLADLVVLATGHLRRRTGARTGKVSDSRRGTG